MSSSTSSTADISRFILSLDTLGSSYAIHPIAWNRHSANFALWVFSEVEFRRIGRTEHRVGGHLCRPRRICSAYGLARRFVLALLLLVEAVDATVWTAEASVGVCHLLHAGDLPEQLAPRRLHRGRGGLDVVHPEAENEAIVEAVVSRGGLGRV